MECLPLHQTTDGRICLPPAPTDQFHYLMGVVGCSLISLFDLQVDDDGLWDYGCLVASWGLESCGCSFGVSMHLPQLVTVEKWGGCCLTVLGCGHWGACGAGDLASSGQGRVLGLGSHARGRLVSGCVPPSVGAVCTHWPTRRAVWADPH